MGGELSGFSGQLKIKNGKTFQYTQKKMAPEILFWRQIVATNHVTDIKPTRLNGFGCRQKKLSHKVKS